MIGVLQSARQRGLIQALKPIIDALSMQAGFWIGDALYQRVLRDAGEE